ncbi:hypothetical protein D3C78_1903550 [compost metagenome]
MFANLTFLYRILVACWMRMVFLPKQATCCSTSFSFGLASTPDRIASVRRSSRFKPPR